MKPTVCTIFAGLLLSGSAWGQCAPRSAILTHLERSYSEVPVSQALTDGGGVLERLAAPAGGWTLIVTTPEGMSCLVASGTAWQTLPPVTRGRGS